MITILGIIVVLAAIIGILWTVHRQDELDEREEELNQISIDLDGRANRLAADEETVRGLELQLRRELIRLGVVEDESPSGDGGENPQ